VTGRGYPFPDELAALPRDRAAVIEASAGTGKTYLIEHLVVDRLMRGEARIDEMLVVTFTERAAAELVRRIRALIRTVLAAEVEPQARDRLEAAERGLDVAPISTIHAFCQGVLTEHAFAGGRLLVQTHVESRTAFALAFADIIRGPLADDRELGPLLAAWLGSGRSVDRLETILYKARALRCDWAMTYDPERLARAARSFAQLSLPAVVPAVHRAMAHKGRSPAVVDRVELLHKASVRFDAHGDPGLLLAEIDDAVKPPKNAINWIAEKLAGVRNKPGIAELLTALSELADAAVPLETAMAQRFGPLVEERLRARKRSAGHYDYEDMLSLVADALRGPQGGELAATLRARFRLAVIDEFQDTDPVQWQIFRTIFLDGPAPRPLYVVGDPKQSIYGFRGADVNTYADACRAIGPGGAQLALDRNFRSTGAVIEACNALLDQGAPSPFFSTGAGYPHPVRAGNAAGAGDAAQPPLSLLRVKADSEDKLPMRVVRATLARAIADELAALLAAPGAPSPRRVFVLTRVRKESQAIATELAARGVPAVVYGQEGLYETDEARHVRDLLRAIADPHDPGKRLRAWLTPFFALPITELPAAAAGGDQPLRDRLMAWHAAAQAHDFADLFGRILDDSGVVRRELATGDGLRRLTNYQHLFEVLAVEAARGGAGAGDLARRLAALVARLVVPAPEEGNRMRVEGDRDAVQIMTMHAAKGLEADVVFVYGGFGPGPTDAVRTYAIDGRRLRLAGRPRLDAVKELVKRERDGEDQRLYYVALTRARSRLYLPFSGNVPEQDTPFESVPPEEYWRLNGGYRHVNRRLRELLAEPSRRRLFTIHDVAIDAHPTGDAPPPLTDALSSWLPAADSDADADATADAATLARLRHARAGAVTTSYSRIKQAHGGYRPPTEMLDEVTATPAAAIDGDADELRGGARAGIFLHALLEKLPLETLRETPALDAWAARDDVRELALALLRRHGRDPRDLPAATRLAHAALTAPLPVVGGELGGLAHAARTAREMEFLFPFPVAAGGPERGFVKGFVDVIFQHEGRAYFGDWKTDRLPVWDAATIAAHVEANYALQERLYALALVQMLGITDAASYEAKFGGTLYVFVRGLARSPAAIRARRPSFDEVDGWRGEIAGVLGGEAGAS
jgi:exodeoxyribonuclease V beta subunit